MSNTIPDLWPSDIDVTEVLTPLAIMRFQAAQLRQRTKGLIEAEVVSEDEGEQRVVHHLELIAPALDRYRYRLFSAAHDRALVYPVLVSKPWEEDWNRRSEEASTQEDFVRIIRGILADGHAKSVIHSLVAQSNERRNDVKKD